MTPKAELIAGLVTDKYSGFVDGDEPLLEAASDERLERFRTATDARRAAANEHTKLETDFRNTSARLKVMEAQLKDAEAPLSEEEFVRRAPASIKATLEALAAEEAELKATLVAGLKDCGADSEEDLKKKTIPELRTLAKYARIEVRDYSGRGLPKDRFAEASEDYSEPPNPYEAGIKALQAETKH